MKTLNIFLGIVVLLVASILGMPQKSFGQAEDATLGGYGELHYNDVIYNRNGPQTPGTFDFHRFVLNAGYDFNSWIRFRSSVEIQHAFVEDGQGRLGLEQAFVDLRYQPEFGLRAGIMLVPVGIINSVHEPPTFNGVERPNVEKFLIPSTWREAGGGIYGEFEVGLSYELYLMAGLDATGITGRDGIRGARQNAFQSSTDNWAVTGRLDYRPIQDFTIGGSYFFSHLSTNATFGNAMEGTTFHLVDAHAIFSPGGFEVRVLGVYSMITNVEDLNATLGSRVGESQYGGYLELSYNLLRLSNLKTDQLLILFARGEMYDTQATTVNISMDPENERYEYTAGLTFKPHSKVAFKADYQLLKSAGIRDIHQLNLGVGFSF